MVRIIPFRGVIPSKDKVRRFVSRPYDKYSMREVEAIVKDNPESFLNIIKPGLREGIKTNPEIPADLKKSRDQYLGFLQEGLLRKADSECFYLYRQQKPDFTYMGIVAAIPASAYNDGTIRIHEQTLARREEKLKEYLKVVGINAEPVLFTYPHKQPIDDLMEEISRELPYAEFEFEGKTHSFWVIDNPEYLSRIQKHFSEIQHMYVADGHHRSASSVLLSEEMGGDGNAPWNNFLGIFFPDHNLQLLAFHRLVKDTGGLSCDEIVKQLEKSFDIEPVDAEVIEPTAMHEFSMYTAGRWCKLKFKNPNREDSFMLLDADLLSRYVLNPVFGIGDIRNDSRIDFVSGLEGPEKLKELVDSGKHEVAFGLYPVSFRQFFAYSDQGMTMPPKSTWFEPKLLNGLVIYDIFEK